MGRSDQRGANRLDRRALLALAGAGIAGWGAGRVLSRTAPIGRDVRASGAVADILSDSGAPTIGPPSASLRLAVYSDYRCPACRHAYPALEQAVAADGDVRMLCKDWPIFGAPSVRAARVALAAAMQGLYPAVHAALMTTRADIDDRLLRQVVSDAGGDWPRLLADLSARQAQVDLRLQGNALEARRIGLPGTPGYLAGPLLVVGAIDATDFARLFARARALQEPAATVTAASRFSGRM